MKRIMPAFRLRMKMFGLCYTILIVSFVSAQTIQSIKADPGTNDPSPPGAILDLAGTAIPGGGNGTYQQYTVKFTASFSSTAITFAFRDDPAFLSLANVSVVDATTSSANLLGNGDFSGGSYSNDGNNFTPNGWTYADTFGAYSGGIVETGANCYTYNFCFYDGAVQAYDAISQTVPTNVGDTYEISFFLADSGCSTDLEYSLPCNFSDLSTNGDTTDNQGNGINIAVYAQAGLPSVGQIQSATVMTGTASLFSFFGGFGGGGFDYTGELTSGSSIAAEVTAITQPTQFACDQIVQANPNFGTAECFSYQNGGGAGVNLPVMFEVTCPETAGQACSQDVLGTDFSLLLANNPNLALSSPSGPLTSSTGGPPLIGFLEGAGLDPVHPCAPNPNGVTPLFQSNQIASFASGGAASNHATGGSTGVSSCWVATYLTPGEAPSVGITSPVNGAIYQQNQTTHATYTCSTVDNTGATGPYLTQASCSANDNPGGLIHQGAQFDTSALGSHSFTATATDSATNTVSQTVTYDVVAATDLAILNFAPPAVFSGSKLTYSIGVGDFGPATALNVSMNDILPPGTSFLSASGSNIACTIVNRRESCTTTPVPCTFASGAVNCNIGTVMPLSFFDLNGAIIEITVQVTAPPGTNRNPTILKDTATVSAANAESRPGNNSTTATTIVIGH
jgi:uncharacterized repeat protein (TIGR01451 family)